MITLVADYKDLMIVIAYYFVYNISIFACFLLICRFASSNFRTMSDLKNIGVNSILNGCFIVVFLSMAGVPPFIGFFTKILLIKLIFNAGFGSFFLLFIITTFISLFFYLQNLRFLLIPEPAAIPSSLILYENTTAILLNTYFLIFIGIFICFGGLFLNDLLLIACWFF